jgi:cytochrome c peroxidase
MLVQTSNDIGLFKTPTLRNIELTAPYMHDGRFQTLEEVIEHYNSGVRHSTTLDPIMTKPSKIYGLGLTITEKQDLVAFLKTLTDTSFIQNPLYYNILNLSSKCLEILLTIKKYT